MLATVLDKGPLDVRPQPKSPVIDAGVPVPRTWPDSLRGADKGKPDIGALPLGAPILDVGPGAGRRANPDSR
jgi:hypothetical protein